MTMVLKLICVWVRSGKGGVMEVSSGWGGGVMSSIFIFNYQQKEVGLASVSGTPPIITIITKFVLSFLGHLFRS